MAASAVSSFFQLMNVSYSSSMCRRFITVLSSDRTRMKRCAGISFCQARAAAQFTRDDQLTHIPTDKLKISYSRSSGAGGQHVNKVSTKADVRFHVQTADWLPESVKTKILLKNKTRINKAGELIVTSDISRSQRRNLEYCLMKISAMITEAQRQPEELSVEDQALREHRSAQRNLQRLKQKKIQAATKQARRVDFD